MKITYDIAMAAARDAGNRNAADNGRKSWSQDNYDVAVEMFYKLYGQC